MTQENKKVRPEDVETVEVRHKITAYKVGGIAYNAAVKSKESLITHVDCKGCGVEFQKQYTYDTHCASCAYEIERKKYFALEEVGWDGKTPLVLFNDDQYFFSTDDIYEYLEDQEGVKSEDLMLCLCVESKFSAIEYDHFADDTHEDWEPSPELERRVKEFNEFLSKESTNTWYQTNKRVTVKIEE